MSGYTVFVCINTHASSKLGKKVLEGVVAIFHILAATPSMAAPSLDDSGSQVFYYSMSSWMLTSHVYIKTEVVEDQSRNVIKL